MTFSLQPSLANEKVRLEPLLPSDFDALYAVASDPELWKQHPNQNRWQKPVFENFFKGAIESKGAFKIIDSQTGDVIGSTRLYDYNAKQNSILIGYTFFAKNRWGKGYNHATKTLMLDYLFEHISRVDFHIGAQNFRSQSSIEKLGAKKIDELEVAYYGEAPKLNFVYRILRNDWLKWREN
ncbi:GNAT family N-acetyltransferase [Roseivirga sp. UBA838]|uniref:GNAT family N-acetyltransferase n=2 Tax=unclassified Roseivirga TaxID=2626142 RepID=UPI00257A9BCB|nr:GNAT family N-acetyltransferase [Roseivirga sp. UBA838]|tara:strand:- start:18418 stop:18960 length:543 start_codon:yes stop_codon:yes gene_type:complete